MNKFLKASTWKMIIRSRLIDWKNRNEPWVKERRAICEECPFNTINIEKKSVKERLFIFLNLSKGVCSACFCGIKRKTLIKQSVCGLEEIGSEPKWKEIK